MPHFIASDARPLHSLICRHSSRHFADSYFSTMLPRFRSSLHFLGHLVIVCSRTDARLALRRVIFAIAAITTALEMATIISSSLVSLDSAYVPKPLRPAAGVGHYKPQSSSPLSARLFLAAIFDTLRQHFLAESEPNISPIAVLSCTIYEIRYASHDLLGFTFAHRNYYFTALLAIFHF
jgi:hypothetical protein